MMILEELSLINFRNLKNQTLKFDRGVNVFWGDNAQGKTNLLEAIYLLASAKSFRSRIDHELVTWGQTEARVRGKTDLLDIELTIGQQSKELTLNRQPRRLTELIGSFIAILFTPADIALVSGAPSERRRFLDQLLSYLSREYLLQVVNLNRILRSRNQLLYQHTNGKEANLDVWDEQLVKTASFLWQERVSVVKKINERLQTLGKKLLQAELQIDYTPPFGESIKEIKERYAKALLATRNNDLVKKQTSLGPHRDDFKIILDELRNEKIISKDLGIYGSRGEQRAASLALKLSEVDLLKEGREVQPILLLDEVLSELDENHRQLLLRQVAGGQTFITSTSLEVVEKVIGSKVGSFLVKNGEVVL